MNTNKKIRRILHLLSLIDKGKPITRTAMERVIGKDGLKKLDLSWNDEKQMRRYKPQEIIEYSRKLTKGLLLYSMADIKSVRKHPSALKAFHKAESALENALQYLCDVLETDPSLKLWVDREPSFDSLTPEGVPRPIWSTSPYKMGSFSMKSTKRDIARHLLGETLEKLQKTVVFEVTKPFARNRSLFNNASFTGFKF